jgi:WD40 repeat protein
MTGSTTTTTTTTTTFSIAQEGSSKSLHLDVSKDNSQVVVASSAVFRIYDIENNKFSERVNLRGTKSVNLNYSCNDVVWNKNDPNILATAATNGAVVIWNLQKSSRSKQEHVFIDHKRTVNKVNCNPSCWEVGI